MKFSANRQRYTMLCYFPELHCVCTCVHRDSNYVPPSPLRGRPPFKLGWRRRGGGLFSVCVEVSLVLIKVQSRCHQNSHGEKLTTCPPPLRPSVGCLVQTRRHPDASRHHVRNLKLQ